jgi:hypothetical protein
MIDEVDENGHHALYLSFIPNIICNRISEKKTHEIIFVIDRYVQKKKIASHLNFCLGAEVWKVSKWNARKKLCNYFFAHCPHVFSR